MSIEPHPYGRVFCAAVGLGDSPVPDNWSALDQKRIYFAERSTQISRGDHLFALGAARKGAVLGLFEVTSSGTERIPSPEDPSRWPHSVAVRPRAAIAPPDAVSVPGVRTPRAHPQQVRNEGLQSALYKAVEAGNQPFSHPLLPGSTYSWEEVAESFEFDPNYITVAGGMISRPAQGALLLITHAGGARPNEYGDYWDEDDLIYTGRGKRGDQRRVGQNRDLGDNLKDIFVFEPAAPRQLFFFGQAICVEEWTEQDLDVEDNPRSVLRFRLSFEERPKGARRPVSETPIAISKSRRPRIFDPDLSPSEPSSPTPTADPEETQVLREKAVVGHHALLSALSNWLQARGWTGIEEIPLAVDLWARMPGGRNRVIFEAKTVRVGSEGPRIRSAIAQLFEYRFLYGDPDDQLCLVCNQPVSSRRIQLLEHLGIFVLWRDGEDFHPGSGASNELTASSPGWSA